MCRKVPAYGITPLYVYLSYLNHFTCTYVYLSQVYLPPAAAISKYRLFFQVCSPSAQKRHSYRGFCQFSVCVFIVFCIRKSLNLYICNLKYTKKNSPAAGLVIAIIECICFLHIYVVFLMFIQYLLGVFLACLTQGSENSTRGMIRKASGMKSP